MNLQRAIEYWTRLAKDDLRVSRHLLESGDRLHALFFCHLVPEKMLKALYVKEKGTQAPPTHNLLRLATEAGLGLSDEDRRFLEELTEFNIEGRYPRDRDALRKKCTKRYVEDVLERVGRWRRRLATRLRT